MQIEVSPPRTDPCDLLLFIPLTQPWTEGRLQIAEWQCPVDWLENLDPTVFGHDRPTAHVEVDEGWNGVEALAFHRVLDLSVRLASLNCCLSDEEVK